MSNFGRCIICTLSFELDDISALRCGHTYHHECILTWINTSKSCPKCRKKNLAKDIIRLYVDEPDKSMCHSSDFDSAPNAELELKVKTLELQLQEVRDEAEKKNIELTNMIANNKEVTATKLRVKDDHIRQLEALMKDQDAMKKENVALKRQLKASDFYSFVCKISSTNEEAEIEKKIDIYSTKNGDPSSGEFLKLVRKQLKAMEQKNKELLEQLRKERLENNKKDKELEKVKEELLQSRKRSKGPSTSNESPVAVRQRFMRPSFGFSFCEEDSEIQIISGGSSSPPLGVRKLLIPKFLDPNSSCQIVQEIKVERNRYTSDKFSIFGDDLENVSPKQSIQLGNDLISPNLLAHASNSNFMNL
ncbi:hypothetical protein ACQ4LE_001730 [Meloidogyne hapla]|uniref:RING-type domain-containing protein n=1 Tax=Meloidogyne hapla TaxID=6305 RepID=A0A1I8B0L7_MELHA